MWLIRTTGPHVRYIESVWTANRRRRSPFRRSARSCGERRADRRVFTSERTFPLDSDVDGYRGGGNLCCYVSTGQIGNDQPITSTAVAESLADLLPAMLPRLWVFSLRLTGNQHDAEDLVQAACARALEREHQLKPGTAPLSWMFSIVQSIWINEVRARKVRQRSNVDWDDSMLNVADPSATPVDEVLFSREVIAAVERLPEAQRTVVVLVAVEGLSYAEAAQVLDIPVGTIMSRLSRARQSIGEKFGKYSAADTQEVTCEIGTAR
jgi:RNA polymerase sigma-70 factor, ECF subfamily